MKRVRLCWQAICLLSKISNILKQPKGGKRGVRYSPRFLIQNLAILGRGIEMRNNSLIFSVSRVIKPDGKEIAIRGGLSRDHNKEWIIVRPYAVSIASMKASCGPRTCPTSSKMAKEGE